MAFVAALHMDRPVFVTASRGESKALFDLYEKDEVEWLEITAELVAQQRWADLDFVHLSEFLTDAANRDRREVKRDLTMLLSHMLTWELQPDTRAGAYHSTIRTLSNDLRDHLEGSHTLQNHAQDVLVQAYQNARKQTAIATELPLESFPTECPWSIDELIRDI